MTLKPAAAGRRDWSYFTAVLALGSLALLWAHWTSLTELAERWSHDPQYSHGYLVPVFACLLLWLRRDLLRKVVPGANWAGVGLLAGGVALRLAGTWFHFVWLEAIAILPCAAGLFVLVGGWPALRWAWPAVAFLFYMVPLPYRFSTSLAGPLQRLATICSTFALQTLGLPALAEGNVILLN